MSKLNKNAFPELTLTLDFGGSGTKGIAQIKGGKPTAFWMEPAVIEASRTSLADKTHNNIGNVYPENSAWVGIGEEYRAVGYLARSTYSATPGLRPRKYELAVYKTLAAVWVTKQKFKLPESFHLSLALLLPPGEFEDSSYLKPMLKEALTQFDTPTGIVKAPLVGYECFPECGGIYAMYCKQAGESIKRSAIALVMVGYRNASVLVSRRGILDRGKTTNLGMAKMVELVMERTSGLQEQPLISAIVAAGVDPKPAHFLPLVSSSDRSKSSVISVHSHDSVISDYAKHSVKGDYPKDVAQSNCVHRSYKSDCTQRSTFGDRSLRNDQIDKIITAVRTARNEYALVLTSWLREVLPPSGELDEAIICGGTADYLKDELDAVFPSTPVVWHGAVKIPPTLNEQWLGSRLADVWALSLYHSAKVRAEARRLEVEEVVASHE